LTLSFEIVFRPDGRRGRFSADINSICGGATSMTDKMVGDDPGQE